MVTRFSVKRLFNLYSYNLDFTNADGSPVKFITGPNGYGKTTVLALLNAVFVQDFKQMLDVPFQEMKVDFDGASLSIEKSTEYQELYEDEIVPTMENMSFAFRPSHDSEAERFSVTRSDNRISVSDAPVFMLFMQSRTSYFVTDQRLFHKKTDILNETTLMDLPAVENNASHLKSAIATHMFNPAVSLSRGVDSMSEDVYKEKRNSLAKRIDALKRYGLIIDKDFTVIPYSEDIKHVLPGYFRGLDESLETVRTFEEKLSLFEKIIGGCDFADKKMQIGPNWGYRFKMNDKDNTPLLLSKLSSGEKQMLIQVYEMLFRAQRGTLVLVDEPEISLHMLWQINYMENLKRIAEMNEIQIIVATHSPEIFGGKWSLTQDLFEQAKSE